MLSAHIRWYIPEYLERTEIENYINLHPAQPGRMKAIENIFFAPFSLFSLFFVFLSKNNFLLFYNGTGGGFLHI